ncbi:MAG: tetratricopeptide repeat protein [Actinomycetota bacterium]
MRRAALAAVLLLIAASCGIGGTTAVRKGSRTVPFIPVDPASTSATDRAIAAAQARLRAAPTDDQARLSLVQAFLQKAREVADPSLYAKARGLLDGLVSKRPGDPAVLVTAGTLALAQHRFAEALTLGKRAATVAPHDASAQGVLVDALNELGRYDEALTATQRMVDIKPGLPGLSRVSYARELRGDLPGAIEAMTQAVVAGGSGENLAYVQVLLGNLLLLDGQSGAAAAQYAEAERSFPGFPAAAAGQARVAVARGRWSEAAELLGRVVRVQPQPEYAIAHGDALTAAGRPAEAADAYELVGVIAKLFVANGVNLDLDLALFDAEQHPGEGAVARARRALRARPGVLGHDALAWNLFRVGRLDEAQRESARSLRLGTRDPMLRFHAAAISFARGDRVGAVEQLRVVLETNPRFSARYVPKVEQLAGALGLSVPPPGEEPG